MHLKPGKATYRLRNVGILQCANYRRGIGPRYALMHVELTELLRMRQQGDTAPRNDRLKATIPIYVAYCFERKTIELHPAPAYAGELEVHYYPPLEVA